MKRISKRILKILWIAFLWFYLWMTYINIRDIYSDDMDCMAIYTNKLNKGITDYNCLYLIWGKYPHIDECDKFNWLFASVLAPKVWYAKWCSMYTNWWWIRASIWDLLNENRCIQERVWQYLFPRTYNE